MGEKWSPKRQAFSPAEVAEALGVCERTVARQLRAGRIRGFKVGRAVRIARTEVERLLGAADAQ